MPDREKVIRGLEACNRLSYSGSDCQNCPYYGDVDTEELPFGMCNIQDMFDDALALLKEQEPRVLSLGEAIEGKNGLEIDPYVFVEIKGREDIFIGLVSDVTHYNYPDRKFSIRESFRIDRSFPASTVYSKTDYMKVVRCWTHIPTAEQRKVVSWDE